MGETNAVRIDASTSMLIALSLVLFLYLTTLFGELPDLAFKSLVGAVLLVGGLVAAHVFVGIKLEAGFFTGWPHLLMFVGLAFASIVFGGQVMRAIPVASVEAVPAQVSVSFMLQMAVAEEVFFRAFLASYFSKMGGVVFGVMGSTAAWVAYHIFVYQTSYAALGFVAIAGIGFGVAFLLGRRNLWITAVVHSLYNVVVGL